MILTRLAFLFQINLALSVIYSRHLIAILLGNWTEDRMITSELMDNSDEVQLIGLLDILQRLENKELFEKVTRTRNNIACYTFYIQPVVTALINL